MNTAQTGPDRPPEQRKLYVKFWMTGLTSLSERFGLGRSERHLVEHLVLNMAEDYIYEPRILQAPSLHSIWDLLGYNGRKSLPALIDAGLVAEHPGLGIEVLCWDELVADTDKEKADRRKRAVADLARGGRKAAKVRTLYTASRVYDLPIPGVYPGRDTVHPVHDTVHPVHDAVHPVHDAVYSGRTRPAKTAPRSLDHLDPLDPAPPSDGADPVRFDAAGGEGNQEPGTDRQHRIEALAEASQTATLEAGRFHAQVLDRLTDRAIEAAIAEGFQPRTPTGFRNHKRSDVKADPNLGNADNVAHYRNDHPDADASTLADLIWSDRPGASPPIRPSPPSPEVAAARRAVNGTAQAEAVDFQKAYE